MDKKTSKDVEKIIDQQAKFQHTPADIHRANITKQCCRTHKNHFTEVRAGTPPSFRMENWCKMTEQCDITLIMMRPCTLNPRISAFQSMEGMYYFDATPMAPVGTETMIHLKPVRRHTCSYHAVKAWYFALSLKHCCVIKTTNKSETVRTTDTWNYNHHSIKTPTVTPVDIIIKATTNLAIAIQCHNDAPQYELEAIEHLRALTTGNSAPTIHQATEQKVEPPVQRHLEPEHISELMAPVVDFEPTTFPHNPHLLTTMHMHQRSCTRRRI